MSADERVDILSEDGVVIGQATRSRVRRENLLHRSVYVLVFDPAGHLLVHQRTATKDIYPGWWDVTVGGVLGSGEAPLEGARRELREEIGAEPETVRELFTFRFEGEGNRVIGTVFDCTWDGPVVLQATEVARAEWLDLDAAVGLSRRERFCPDGLEVLRLYREGFGGRGERA